MDYLCTTAVFHIKIRIVETTDFIFLAHKQWVIYTLWCSLFRPIVLKMIYVVLIAELKNFLSVILIFFHIQSVPWRFSRAVPT